MVAETYKLHLSFQIHERLRHYEEGKPTAVLKSAAALAHEVSFMTFMDVAAP